MNANVIDADAYLDLVHRYTSGLMGIAEWLDETGHVHQANNLRSLVMPYIEKLKKSRLNDRQQTCLDMLSGNVANILSSFARKLSPAYLNLTPTEILVANLIKEGKTSKEIGEALNTSFKTIEGHRRSIRKKTGIAGRRVDLKTHLAALDSGAARPAPSPNIGSWLPFRPKTNRSTHPAARHAETA